MTKPTKKLERQLFKRGYQVVCGLDEVGRGAWAGPLVAAATIGIQNSKLKIKNFGVASGDIIIRDSKTLNHNQRVKAAKWLKKNCHWAIGQVESWEIDAMGLGQANVLVMQRAVAKFKIKPDYFLIDGNTYHRYFSPSKSIVAGDAKVWCIAAASIIAKVYRDSLMKKLHRQYPQYGFDQHVGYGTKQHKKALKIYGPCVIHRKSYKPIMRLSKSEI
jgi:ribonuclease HII